MPKVKPSRATAKSQGDSRTKAHKRQAAAPFLEPSPVHHRTKLALASAVTPSPKPKRVYKKQGGATELSSGWLVHDKLLHGASGNDPFVVKPNFDSNWRNYLLNNWQQCCELEVLLKDPMFQYPHLVEMPEGENNEWRQYVMDLSFYPTERIQAVLDEYKKDMTLHDELLKSMRDEINERRHGGRRFYLRALNCILFDTFTRCHVPLPPLPTWKLEVEDDITRKALYKKQLSAWLAYKTRVFEVLGVIIKYPALMERAANMFDITPLEHRGQMVHMKELCKNEEKCIPFTYIPSTRDEGVEEPVEEDGDLIDKPGV
ncbi:hypothetical protein HJC23_004332 [Cyclotella cryptica]|uniref:Uncharacterized protein n=1 Tax=Cyclotella cryptica TaxID=29204 RepID=A0ABD3Q9W7_9STRA|eukprot:CCRYP_008938-RA/>CCRYP_008938-RA protein AED:0.43 eAED:0.43 QI:0/-1/0/1/-1/1/1/0/315